MRDVCIFWNCPSGSREREEILRRLDLPRGMTINGETYCRVHDGTFQALLTLQERGWIKLRNKTKKI